MDRLKKVSEKDVSQVLQYLGLSHYQSMIQLLTAWEKITGGRLASHVRVADLKKDGTLLLEVNDSTWLTELRFMRKELLEKIRNETDVEVKKIELRFKNF